ncbi:MAG TPA: PHB depolymerase family esterase [Polyangiaceae bacterium]|nr:PHB depolymerase family esterase [Polyangiaceae bacterium]
MAGAGASGNGGIAGIAGMGGAAGGALGGTGGAAAGAGGMTSGMGGRAGAGGDTPSCPAAGAAVGDSNQTVTVDGMSRGYVLHIPAAYSGSKPVPLVVDLHGIGQTGAKERASSPYPAVLDPEGVVMAFPDGMKGPAGTAWNVGPCCVANVDDVAFARAVVEHVEELACIDRSRVYAVGVLTGGGLAHYLACHAADVFAAVAPAAFDLLAENVDGCLPSRPVTVISFRGTAVSRVPYEGGPSSLVPMMPLTFLGAEATFDKWAELDRCVGPASPPDADGCSAYSGCDDGAEVILCTKEGGGEDPGDPSIAWPVLLRHTL